MLVVVLGLDVVELENQQGLENYDHKEKSQSTAEIQKPFNRICLNDVFIAGVVSIDQASHGHKITVHSRSLIELQVKLALVLCNNLIPDCRYRNIHLFERRLF